MANYYTPNIVHSASLGPLLLMHTLDRLRRLFGQDDPAVVRIARGAWVDAGYCIDAPETIPAGSTMREQFGPDDDDWVPMATSYEREAEHGN